MPGNHLLSLSYSRAPWPVPLSQMEDIWPAATKPSESKETSARCGRGQLSSGGLPRDSSGHWDFPKAPGRPLTVAFVGQKTFPTWWTRELREMPRQLPRRSRDGPTLRGHELLSWFCWQEVEPHLQMLSLHRKHGSPGVGSSSSCPAWPGGHLPEPSTAEKVMHRHLAHTTSVFCRITGPRCLPGEVTGRKACSMPGFEKSGKILCSRANF